MPWIIAALRNVDEQYVSLGLTEEDFETAEGSEWEPIPIDRDDPKLKQATEAIGEAIKAIEGDNGYAVHARGERDYVLSNLKGFQREIGEKTTIYALQVKAFVLDPLARVIARFGTAATGLAASAARQAVFDWIRTHVGKILSLFLP